MNALRFASLTLLLLALAAPARPEELLRAVETELRDQRGETDSVAAHRGTPTVAMVVTAKRLRNLRGWQRDLQARFDQVDYVLIADVPAEPPVTYERVAEKLGGRVPDGVSVLIDLDRAWATELELDTDRPNLLLFDAEGRLAARFRGRKQDALVEEVARELSQLVGS